MLYIVYIAVAEARADSWSDWMREVHIPDVMATGCFAEAVVARDEEADRDGMRAWRIVYRAPSRGVYERYRDEFAEALQRDHTERYQGDFEARRELLDVEGVFVPDAAD
jgi:hypothetical protein